MKLLPLWLILLSMAAHSQSNDNIIIGKKDSIYSGLLHEKREVWIHLPRGASDLQSSAQRYPVVYLLDGDGHFFSVAGLVQQFSEINGNTLCPAMIIVGIPNTDRERDLTPTHVSKTYYGDSEGVRTSGGGELFTSFLEKELVPHIDSMYPTAPYRVFIGHSLGGLMVINTLVHHPGLFNAYIAIDPSMWWDNQKLLNQAATALHSERFSGKKLFIGVANTMPDGMDTAAVRKDTTGNTLHIRSILQLTDILKKEKSNGLEWKYQYYPDDTHGTVPMITEYEGLRFIFGFYNFKNAGRIFDKNISASASLDVVTSHYKKISEELGYPLLPPENEINNLGYALLQNKMYDKAYLFFKLNVDNYPKSGNTYDSMGDYYIAVNDKQHAKEYFSKALAVNENADTRAKLDKLMH